MKETVYSAFVHSATSHGQRPFLHIPRIACSHYSDGAIDISYAQALQRIDALAERYRGAGYGAGHRVALMLENRPEFFVHWLALNQVGASVVPLNAEQRPSEIAWLIEHSEACLLSVLPDRSDLAQECAALLREPVPVWDGAAATLPAAAAHAPALADECAILYTSGSTGKPKGCVLGNDYFTRFGLWYKQIGGICTLREGCDRLITPLPLSHMNAMATSAMGMIMSAGCIVQLDRFHPGSWWDTVRSSEATIVHYLGVMPAILLQLPSTTADDHSARVRFGFGAGVNPRHHATFEQRFGFPLIEAWAMTESGSGGCIIANHEPRHIGSCCFGKPSDAVQLRLVAEDGSDCPDGEPGELLVRASGDDPRAGFFAGYLKDEAASEAIWSGGWLHTGDVVRAGPDGSLHFVDRRKNVIRRSGENIAALEVEAALAGDPAVAELIITAVPDEIRGEEVMACVVVPGGVARNEQTARAIQQRALDALVYFKAPGYVVFVDSLPRTASQKPQRGEIRKLVPHWLESAHCFDLRGLKRRPGASGK
jgi:acyl-CoA synthetase (AMP-forming)/AMP-acid ligase II